MQTHQIIELSVVVPVYKEAAMIRPFLIRTEAVLQAITPDYDIIFCLDPSPDETEAVILEEIKRNEKIKLMVFSRRFGQPAATMAGLFSCQGKACVVMDVDLQDPPAVIADLYTKLQEGYEVVYAKRRSREGESRIRLMLTHLGYYLMHRLGQVEIPRNVGDFRIMSRRVIEEMRRLNESHGFLKGLVAFVGFKQTCIEYDRLARHAGKGHYNRLTGSIPIALNGLFGFSSRPLFLLSFLGLFLVMMSGLLGGMALIKSGLQVHYHPAVSPLVWVVSFFAGIQLLGLGLLGEYVGRIYEEVKQRPLYIVDKQINFEKKGS